MIRNNTGWICSLLAALFLKSPSLLGGTARETVLGPGKTAILNSTIRPAIPDPVNGLTEDFRAGVDFSYSGLSKKNENSTSDLTGFDIITWGLLPLYYYAKNVRPSGLTLKLTSRQQTGKKNSTVSSNELATNSQLSSQLATGQLQVGGVFSITNNWMFSLKINYENENFTSTEKSTVRLSQGDEESEVKSTATGNFTNAEYGFRLKLTKETSVALTYNDGYFNKTGVSIESEKNFLGSITASTSKSPLFSQSHFGMALKTRYFSHLTFAFGLLRAFEVKTQKETGEPVILAEEFSDLGMSIEYRFKLAGKTWLPRIGFETQTLGKSKLSAGLSIQQGALEFDTAVAQSILKKDSKEENAFFAILGIGYRFIDGSDEQEDQPDDS